MVYLSWQDETSNSSSALSSVPGTIQAADEVKGRFFTLCLGQADSGRRGGRNAVLRSLARVAEPQFG